MPGVLRAGDREQPGLPGLPGQCGPTAAGGSRPEGVDEPGPVRAAVRAPHPDRDARVRAQRDHRAVRRHGQPRHHRAARSRRCTARRVLRGLLRRRPRPARPPPRRGRRRLVHRHGPPALRAQHRALAPRPIPAATTGAAGRGTAPPGALDPTAVGEATELLWAFRAQSRATQRRLAAGETLGPETSDRQGAGGDRRAGGVRPGRRRAWARTSCSGDDPVSERWRAEFLYSRAATIYGGSAEIQRNIIARRLLDLGDDR